jgi:hypothetical protein
MKNEGSDVAQIILINKEQFSKRFAGLMYYYLEGMTRSFFAFLMVVFVTSLVPVFKYPSLQEKHHDRCHLLSE